MALDNTSEMASRLFKKSLGVGETLVNREFFNESFLGRTNILPYQIWTEAEKIPLTAPTLSDQSISGVTQYWEKLTLTHVNGATNLSYYNENLKDAIPFNYGVTPSYGYKLYKNDGVTQIPDGSGDWLVDTEAGLLTFYGPLPTNVSSVLPPKISFYKYVGKKGLSSLTGDTATISTALSIETSTRLSVDNSLSVALSSEIVTRSSSDNSLSTGLSSESSTRTSVDNSLSSALSTGLSTETSTRLSVDNSLSTGLSTSMSTEVSTRLSVDNSLSSAISTQSSIRLSVDNSLSIGLSTEVSTRSSVDNSLSTSLLTHVHSKLVDSGGTQIVYVDNGGNVHIDANIYQTGSTWETHAQRIYTSGDTIILREGATAGLGSALAGFEAIKYDGFNTGQLVFDSGGTARVGDIGFTQPIATREETPLSNGIAYWDSGSTTFKTKDPLTLPIPTLVSTALSIEASTRLSVDNSLSSAISTSISTEVSTRSSVDNSLSSVISTQSSIRLSVDNSLSTGLSTSMSTEVSTRLSVDNSLSSAISTQSSIRLSVDNSLSTAISIETSSRMIIDGSGLTYNNTTNKLDVNVDDMTIKIISDELRTPITWMQFDSSTEIPNGLSGNTGISLTHEPVGYVSAYVNGVEYLVSTSIVSQINIPFYFTDVIPTVGSILKYDSTRSGFGLQSGIDLIMIKYSYIDLS